jgi:MoxR-like ATPase
MMMLKVAYPTKDEEERIVASTTGDETSTVSPVLGGAQMLALQHLVRRLPAPPSVVSYAVKLARATRPDSAEASARVKKYVSWGAGPRASQYLVLGAKARAAMDGRGVPDLEDVNAMATAVLGHRIVVNFQAEAEGIAPEALIEIPDKP